jgi:hypothetical protein
MKRENTVNEICEEFDITPITLNRWIDKGCPVTGTGRGKKFDKGEVALWVKQNNISGKVGRPAAPISQAIQEATLRKILALAEGYEINIAKQLGELVLAEDAKAAITSQITVAKQKLINLGAAIAPSLEGMPASTIQTIIENRINEVLNEIGGA